MWVGRRRESGKFSVQWRSPVTSHFSLTPTPWDTVLFLPKPFSSLNPRWHSLNQNALARVFARQNTPALQATTFAKVSLRSVGLFLLRDALRIESTRVPRGTFKAVRHRSSHPLETSQWRRDGVQVLEKKMLSGWMQHHDLGLLWMMLTLGSI